MSFRLPPARRKAGPITLVAAAVALLGAVSAFAAEPQGGAMSACAADLGKFCPGIEAGGGKKMRCLMDNRASLSATCSGALNARQSQRDAMRMGGTSVAQAQVQAQAQAQTQTPAASPPVAGSPPPAAPTAPSGLPKASPLGASMRACRTDMAALCGAVQQGGGRRIKCLMDNQAKLSPDCAAAVSSAQDQRQAQKQSQKQASRAACQDDVAKFCATAKGPARLQCLDANKASLVPACADILSRRLAKQDARAAAPQKP